MFIPVLDASIGDERTRGMLAIAGILGTGIWILIIGTIAGFIARALVPGRDAMSVPQTIALGIVGSLIGGFLGRIIGHDKGDGFFQTASIFGSVVGSVIALLLYRQFGSKLKR
jgi:uncharacterized membrane protein YeaQ/YmgE (transglycosylase-associated protein family)